MSAHSFEYYEPVGYYQRGAIEDRVAKELGQHMYVSEPPPPPDQCTPREQRVARFTTGYAGWPAGELFYFPLRARCEPVRLILHYAGVNYFLNTVPMGEWPELKGSTAMNGCDSMPIFKPDGGGVEGIFNETVEIAKWICKESGKKSLLPDDPKAHKLFMLTMDGPLTQVMMTLHLKDAADGKKVAPEVSKACVAELKAKAEPDLVAPFIDLNEPHYGDNGNWAVHDNLTRLDPAVLTTLGPKWQTFYEAVAKCNGIKEYIAVRPKAGKGKLGKPGSMFFSLDLDEAEAKKYNYETDQ